MKRASLMGVIAIVLAALLAVSCSGPAPQGAGEPGDIRIASLSPAISRTLVDLDLAGSVVGRSQYCSSLDASIPAVGDLEHVDYERLLRLKPTHVLVQPPSSGIDQGLVRLAAEQGWTIGSWKLNTCEDIRRLVLELPATLHAHSTVEGEALKARAEALVARMDIALDPSSPAWRGRVLIVDSTGPVMVYGRRTYLDELAGALGAQNATTADRWKELSLEDITRIDPEAIVLVDSAVPAGADVSEAMGSLAELDVSAVRESRMAVLRSGDADLPSSAVVEAAEELRRIFESFGDADS